MKYEKFVEVVTEKFKEKLVVDFPQAEVEMLYYTKNNISASFRVNLGTPELTKDNMTFNPVLHLVNEREACEISKRGQIQEYVEELYQILKASCDSPKLLDCDIQELIMPANLRLCVAGKNENNDEVFKNVVKKEFLDMICHCKLCLAGESGEEYTMSVTKEILNRLEMTEEEAFEVAKKNTFSLGFVIKTLMESLQELMKDFPSDEEDNFDLYSVDKTMPMYIITNEVCNKGAVALYFPEVFKPLSELLKCDLYIIPSSIHECIVIPVSHADSQFGPYAVEEIHEMIQEVNATQLKPDEVLTDSLYKYLADKNQIIKVA